MGKKLNSLLGRSPVASKLKMQTKLAISRIAILKKVHNVRSYQALSDVTQILQLGHKEDALLRVEHVIKEQSMLDALALIEGYCHLLREEIEMIKSSRECPEELKEAISSLIFAASRCGDFPELQEIRMIFTSKYGKEFAAEAVELRNNCGVYPKMIHSLSTRQASLDSRHEMIKRIAKDNGIQLAHQDFKAPNNEQNASTGSGCLHSDKAGLNSTDEELSEANTNIETYSESVKARKSYKDVRVAAQDAYESAAYAAEAARTSIELSTLESWEEDPDDHSDSDQENQHDTSPFVKLR